MRLRFLSFTVILSALACAWPAGADEYVAFRFLPGEKPSVYMRLTEDKAWVASSAESLKTAPVKNADPDKTLQWVDRDTGGKATGYIFEELFIPSPDPEHFTVTARLQVERIIIPTTQSRKDSHSTRIFFIYTFRRLDSNGVWWSYQLGSKRSEQALSVDPEAPTIYDVPTSTDAKLALQTQIAGYQARVGAVLFLGETNVINFKKNNDLAHARLEIYDEDGELVDGQDGDLVKFGFT